MKITELIMDPSIWEKPVESQRIPEIDLYMEQILTLLEDRGVTKTMINNYSKEHLIDPLKGKRYNKEQILQILTILELKQNLSLGRIKKLMPQGEDIDFRKVYEVCSREDEKLRNAAAEFVKRSIQCNEELNEKEADLAASIMLSSCAGYFTKLCEELAGEPEEETDPDKRKKAAKEREKREKKEKKALEKELK